MENINLNIFSKAELIEGIKGLNDWERERLIRNMLYEKQSSILNEVDLNVAERRKLVDKLKNTPKQKQLDVWEEIHENDKKYDKLQKQLDKLDNMIYRGD